MPRLSILIPWLGAPQHFESTLVSVLQNRPAGCEVVLAHSPDYDDPYHLNDEVKLLHFPEAASRVALINAALPHLNGEVIHLLGCGIEVTEHWTEPALAHFHDPVVAAVSPAVSYPRGVRAGIAMSNDGRRIEVFATTCDSLLQSIDTSVAAPAMDAAFYHRDVLQALGGFDESVGDGFADLDLALAIEVLGLSSVVEPSMPITLCRGSATGRPVSSTLQSERFFARHGNRCTMLGRMQHHVRSLIKNPLAKLISLAGSNSAETHVLRVRSAAAALETAAAQTISFETARAQRNSPDGAKRRAA